MRLMRAERLQSKQIMVDMEIKHLVFAEGKYERTFKEKAARNAKQYYKSHVETVKTISFRSKSSKKSHFKINNLNIKSDVSQENITLPSPQF